MGSVTNDLKATELISKSLSGDLSTSEQADLDEYLDKTKETSSFSRLSSTIHESIVEMSTEGALEDVEEGLSEVARERLRRSVRKAKLAADASDAYAPLKVAENETTYSTGSDAGSDAGSPTDESDSHPKKHPNRGKKGG